MKHASRAILQEIENATDAMFIGGVTARGRDEFFDGQHRIKLVDGD